MSNHFLSAELLIQIIPVSQAQLGMPRQRVDRDAERKIVRGAGCRLARIFANAPFLCDTKGSGTGGNSLSEALPAILFGFAR